MGFSTTKAQESGGTVTLHCGQYTTVYHVQNGKLDTIKSFKNGKKFNPYLVPEPISRAMYRKFLTFAEYVGPAVNIEQKLSGKDL